MNKLEEYKSNEAQRLFIQGEAEDFNEEHDIQQHNAFIDGFDAVIALDLSAKFAEWIDNGRWKRERGRNGVFGKWYVPSAGYGGGEPTMYTTKELYQYWIDNVYKPE